MTEFLEILKNQIMEDKHSNQMISEVSETVQNKLQGFQKPGSEGWFLLKM